MTDEQKENIEISNKFLGYGDPEKAIIYFFGIEEGSPFESIAEFEEWKNRLLQFTIIKNREYYYDISFDPTKRTSKVRWPTEGQQAHLAFKILNDIYKKNMPSLEEYYNEYYIKDEKRVMCCNVYPLGSPGEKIWPTFYPDLTGFNGKNEYYEYSWNESNTPREDVLTNFIKFITVTIQSDRKFFVFIMGNSAITKLKPILEKIGYNFPTDNKFPKQNEPPVYNKINRDHSPLEWHCSSCGKVWLTGHPSWGGFNEKVADRIVNYLKEHVSL